MGYNLPKGGHEVSLTKRWTKSVYQKVDMGYNLPNGGHRVQLTKRWTWGIIYQKVDMGYHQKVDLG